MLLFAVSAPAQVDALTDPKLEKQARQLDQEVIAPCCWTNPIGEHYSPEATQLKRRVRQMLADGQSVAQIKQSLVDEFGERILGKPRGRGFNLLVWVIPPMVLLLALFVVYRYLKGHLKRVETVLAQKRATIDKDRKEVEEELQRLGEIG